MDKTEASLHTDIEYPEEDYIQALVLAEVIKRILKRRAGIDLSDKPLFELKPITEFMQRMRVSSLEKFSQTTYIATINYYVSEENQKKHQAIGAIVVYISEDYIGTLFKELHYPVIDEDDQDAATDACGTFCNLVAGNFKAGLGQLGYQELYMSHFMGYQNEVIEGVMFDPKQNQKYEISFEINGIKRIIIDLTMGQIPIIQL